MVTGVALAAASVKNFPVATFCNLNTPSDGGASCAAMLNEHWRIINNNIID
jgi:hypothetical protein